MTRLYVSRPEFFSPSSRPPPHLRIFASCFPCFFQSPTLEARLSVCAMLFFNISMIHSPATLDCWWNSHPKLQAKMSLRKCHKFAPNLRAIQQNSSHHSTHRNSSYRSIRHRSNHRSRKCPWCMSVQIPEFPSLPLISSFPSLRDQQCFALVYAFGSLARAFGSFGFSFGFSLLFFALTFA